MRVGIVTLGCDKNTVDNEYLAGLLEAGGCELVIPRPGEPTGTLDAAIVTTCGFIDKAKQQSIDTIVQLAERKRAGGNPRRLFVAGCLVQRYADDLFKEIPEIDGMVGVGQYRQLAQMIMAADAQERARDVAETPTVDIYQFMRRRRLEATPHAFLKVSDGCNHNCTFCSIPLMKGRLRSVAPEILLEEASRLIADGVREINLVAQDLSMYGMDRWKNYRLPELLRDLCALDGDFWLRCLYYYPGLVTDTFLDVLAAQPKLVKYLDMPLQHLDADVLRSMKRPFHAVNTVDLVRKIRAAVPGITLRSTLIVGFPGETQAQHERVLELIDELELDRLGAFEYSREEDTPAGRMPGQVPKKERNRRWHAVMAAQARVAERLAARRIGRRERVLLESYDPHQQAWSARSPAEAPEIDGKIYVRCDADENFRPGDFVQVEITESAVYDLYARPLAVAAF